jgi:hypothetical protein
MPTQQADPDDGFDETIDLLLSSRRTSEKPDDWSALYALLFPHEEIPEPGMILLLYRDLHT